MSTKNEQENPLANILINVLIPVFALGSMSKEGDKLWHIGPVKGMIIALAIPLAYGIWYFIKTRKTNIFSLIGLISVALTGGLTLYLWNQNGTIKPHADVLFGIKEACIPFILGICVLVSAKSENPLLNEFLYTDSIFNVKKIESSVAEKNQESAYQLLLHSSTKIFSASFFLSAILNMMLAYHFLHNLDHTAANAREVYNEQVGKITGWGFLVIGVPMLIILGFIFMRLMKGLKNLTGLEQDDILLPK